jgi:hypothetical protein
MSDIQERLAQTGLVLFFTAFVLSIAAGVSARLALWVLTIAAAAGSVLFFLLAIWWVP